MARGSTGVQNAKCCYVFLVGGCETVCQFLDRLTGFLRGRVDLVVYIRDVARIHDLGVEHVEQAVEHVEHHCRAAVADVYEVVHGRSADVDGDPFGINWGKGFFAAGRGVVKLNFHTLLYGVSDSKDGWAGAQGSPRLAATTNQTTAIRAREVHSGRIIVQLGSEVTRS